MGLLNLLAPVGLTKAISGPTAADMPERIGKTWHVDPFSYLESLSHRDRASMLSYDQLRLMATRTDVINAILQTRINQVASFAQPVSDRFGIGYTIVMRNGRAPGSRAAAMAVEQLIQEVLHCGQPGMARDNFESFLRKFTRDSLIYDQACAEVIPRRNGLPAFWEAVDAATIRIAAQAQNATDQLGHKMTDLEPQTPFQQALQQYHRDLLVNKNGEQVPAKYVQLISGTVRATYTEDEMYFGIRNPRTDLNVAGYGMSELEQLVGVVTSYLYAEEYNRRIFSQGAVPKGILNLKGEITDQQLQAFKREWTTLIAGVQNAWKTPVLNAEDIEYVNLQGTNKDMEYMQWMQFLVRIACAIYLIDPAEINFDMPRGLDGTNPMIESSNEAKLRASKDRGLAPLLRFIQRSINEMYVYRVDPDFEFRFVGLDARTMEQQQQIAITGVQSYRTLNEVRAMEDLPPLEMGDIPMNPVYVGLLQAQQQMQMQAQAAAQQEAAAAVQAEAMEKEADKDRKHEKEVAKIEAKADVESAKHQAKAAASKARSSGSKK